MSEERNKKAARQLLRKTEDDIRGLFNQNATLENMTPDAASFVFLIHTLSELQTLGVVSIQVLANHAETPHPEPITIGQYDLNTQEYSKTPGTSLGDDTLTINREHLREAAQAEQIVENIQSSTIQTQLQPLVPFIHAIATHPQTFQLLAVFAEDLTDEADIPDETSSQQSQPPADEDSDWITID